MKPNPQADWKTFKLIVIAAPAILVLVSALLGQWTTTFPLAAFALLAAILISLRGDRGRSITLHVLIAALVLYQAFLLRSTVDEPNVGIVWFLVVPALVALLGERIHVVVWTPVSLGLIVYFWGLYGHYPSMAHPLSLPNLIGATVVISAAAFGVITQRARRERALKDALAEAQRESLERKLAEAEARKADAAVTTFLGSMSHELRTPLTNIVLSADALDNTLSGSHQRVWTRNIRESADALVLLLNDILDLARGDAGAAALRNQVYNVEELIESVRAIVQPVALERDICLFVGVLPDVPTHWYGDPARVRQVLVNLVNNALAHARGTRVFLQARINDGQLEYRVGDDGVGIAPEHQRRIFQPFQQLESVGAEQARPAFGSAGTGLGLSIASDFVGAMGSELTVTSQPGQGAIFAFALPRGAQSADNVTTFAERYPRSTGWPAEVCLEAPCEHAIAWAEAWLASWDIAATPTGERIAIIEDNSIRLGSVRALANRLTAAGHFELPPADPSGVAAPRVASEPLALAVCDDDATILQIIGETLQLAGHHVACFADGDALLAHLCSAKIDAVILDVNLGDESGVDVMQQLRALPGPASRMPVCMLSGAWNHKARCLAAGANEYLLKPSSGEELLDTVARLVREQRALPVDPV